MIKLKNLLLEYKQASTQLTKQQFSQVFRVCCTNIKHINQLLYRRQKTKDEFMLFNSANSPTRPSAYGGVGKNPYQKRSGDSFYN